MKQARQVRFIGIRHRVKQTAAGEARPTQVFILDGDKKTVLDLPDDQAELDFVRGLFPTAMRPVEESDNLSQIPARHLSWRKFKKNETVHMAGFLKPYTRETADHLEVPDKVPAAYEGLREGDIVGMVLGGSGDRLAASLSRRGETIGASVYRVPPFIFKEWREQANGFEDKSEDAELLAMMVRDKRASFYKVESRDRALIRVAEALNFRHEALQAKIACEQRLHAGFIGSIFLSEEGGYPEGVIEEEYAKRSASDVILQNLERELKRRELELKKAVEATALWDRIFEPIEGIGPRLAAAFIAKIVDIRRFSTDAKLKAFCGAHVLPDGRFPRRRSGAVANWSPDLRQALYLLGDQFNRRPDSKWGQKLLEYKAKMRQAHPEPIMVDVNDSKTGNMKKVKKYSDGHIHRMATWRTLTKFVEWLHREWWRLEDDYQREARHAA